MGIRPQDAALPQRLIAPEPHQSKPVFGLGMFQKFHHLWSRDEPLDKDVHEPGDLSWLDQPPPKSKRDWPMRPVGLALSRQDTLKQQDFDDPKRLSPIASFNGPPRPVSRTLRQSMSLPRRRASSTPAPHNPARTSAPAVANTATAGDSNELSWPVSSNTTQAQNVTLTDRGIEETSRPSRSPSIISSVDSRTDSFPDAESKAQLNAELDTRWILNLSMHFRDKTDREKFFVTYAESPNKWRRVTISCDYRNAEPGSLEMDLKQLQFQRDKNLMIYESIRDSLPEIQFYDTVTNLKLETSDSRLHVHVTEDVNEIIPYPPRSTVAHLLDDNHDEYRPKEVRESELSFESHLSGFVYKVFYHERTCIKKEIPGPDTVDEFLYEINALYALRNSARVIQLEAIVLDDSLTLIKGLLISYAEQGAIVDLLYDLRGKISLDQRLGWGRDAVIGLSEIHEEGYVQGDFTLSNIVVDSEGKAKIIDINRRGCPVGWEPPEIRAKIASHQRIFMYIGEKSDLYQLGMTLWGLAADDDEPERHDLPLLAQELPEEVPAWYKEIVTICLSEQPRDRWSAKDLIKLFPADLAVPTRDPSQRANSELDFRRQKRYIDPATAVEREDIDQLRNRSSDEMLAYSPQSSRDDYTFTYPRSSDYDRGSATSGYERPRGRRPPTNLEHLTHRERRAWSPDEPPSPADSVSVDDDDVNILEIAPGKRTDYEEIEFEGKPFLIARNTFSDDEMKILEHRATLDESREAPDSGGVETGGDNDAQADFALRQNDTNRSSFTSGASTTSNRTLRNSSANIPQLSNQHKVENDNEIMPQSPIGNHMNTNGSSEDPTHVCLDTHSSSNEPGCSDLSQPPPRLQYADSGFHEPLFLDDEVEPSKDDRLDNESAIRNQNPTTSASIHTPHSSEQDVISNVASPELSAGSFKPRPPQRSDTAFKVVCSAEPRTSSGLAGDKQTDHKPAALNHTTNSLEATNLTDTPPLPVNPSISPDNT